MYCKAKRAEDDVNIPRQHLGDEKVEKKTLFIAPGEKFLSSTFWRRELERTKADV